MSSVLVAACMLSVAAGTPNFMIFMPDDFEFKWSEAPEGTPQTAVEIPTEHFNRVRDDGAVFERAYTASPKCAPSRFSLLTGRYSSRGTYAVAQARQSYKNDASWNGRTYIDVPQTKLIGPDYARNVQTVLKANGYETIHSGKWHVFPNADEAAYLADYNSLVAAIESTGFSTVASAYVSNMGPNGETDGTNTWSHNPEWMVETALAAVATAVGASKPFFLHMTPTGPHNPKTYKALFDFTVRQTPAGVLTQDPVTTMRSRTDLWAAAEALSADTDVQEMLAANMWVDDMLGAMLDGLDNLQVLDDTVVIVCLDHGVDGKATLGETGTRIMQAVMHPSVTVSSVASVVSNIDTPATILDMAGLTAPYTIDGVSWLAEVQGTVPATTLPKFMEFGLERAVVAGGFKYHEGALYDLEGANVGTDLSGDAGHAGTLAAMEGYMACHDTDTSAERNHVGSCTQTSIPNVFVVARSASVLSSEVTRVRHNASSSSSNVVLDSDVVPLWAAGVALVVVMCTAALAMRWYMLAKQRRVEENCVAEKAAVL